MIFQTQIFDLGEDIIFFNFPIKEFAWIKEQQTIEL